jgi:hypothetical protein
MFLPDGVKLAAVDAMHELWTDQPVTNPCPKIGSLSILGKDRVAGGSVVRANLTVAGAAEPVAVNWRLCRDKFKHEIGEGELPEAVEYPSAIVRSTDLGAELRMPGEGGAFRLYAFVRTTNYGAAVASVPICVTGSEVKPRAVKVQLPFVLCGTNQEARPFAPTGLLGDSRAIRLMPDCPEGRQPGTRCTKFDLKSGKGWGGVVWLSPANDWGEEPGGYDLTGARNLTFWACGAEGGEKVEFFFGIIKKDRPFADTATGRISVELTPEWTQYRIDLARKDLSRIKSGFGWTVHGQGQPVTFYLDDVRYE